MATSVYFNQKMRTLPGVYATITSGKNTATRSLDYGTVLLIDTGVYGAGYGGGSGVNGSNLTGKDAVYEFEDLQSFRSFVKGGMFWKCAEALFTPDPRNADAVGISRLLFARAATTAPATMTWSPTGGTGNGGTFKIKTIDEGLNANGVLENTLLKKGYAYTVELGSEDPTKVVFKLWLGTYTGDYTDPITGNVSSYDENTVAGSEPILICESPEIDNFDDLVKWAQSDENFAARFIFDSTSAKAGTGAIAATDVTSGYVVATGGTESYASTDLEKLLGEISDVEYNIVMTDQIGANGNGSLNGKVIKHINTEAKFNKFMYIGAYDSKANFASSLAMAQALNNAYIVCVHGGVGTASDYVPTKMRWWGVFYNLCSVVGRVSGKPPYVPVTNKTIGGDKLYHIPTEKEMEKAVKAGLVVVYPNPYLGRFVVLQGVTTLQDNTVLFNRKGHSFSIQFMRIIAQLNKECVVNAEIDLMGDENGVNINTLSKGSLETWTINFLQRRVATDTQDNLIAGFQNVVATRVDDYYKVTYEVLLNSEITKIFFTGFLLGN